MHIKFLTDFLDVIGDGGGLKSHILERLTFYQGHVYDALISKLPGVENKFSINLMTG